MIYEVKVCGKYEYVVKIEGENKWVRGRMGIVERFMWVIEWKGWRCECFVKFVMGLVRRLFERIERVEEFGEFGLLRLK